MRRVILISGHQGSGKTTLARDLKELLETELYIPKLIKFASPIYGLHDKIYKELTYFGMNYVDTDGTLLQFLGAHMRHIFGPDVWMNIAHDLVREALQITRSIVVIDDLRYQNEIDVWSRNESILVRLTCPENLRKTRAEKWREDTGHASEISLDYYHGWDLEFDTSQKRMPMQYAKEVFKCLSRS